MFDSSDSKKQKKGNKKSPKLSGSVVESGYDRLKNDMNSVIEEESNMNMSMSNAGGSK